MRPTDEQLKLMGLSLRKIDPSTLQLDPEGGDVDWYLGDNGTELFIWSQPGSPPHHLQLVFSRVSVEWSAVKGLATGTFSAAAATAGGRYDSYVLNLAHSIDPDVCRAAVTLLKASKIASERLSPLIAALEAVA